MVLEAYEFLIIGVMVFAIVRILKAKPQKVLQGKEVMVQIGKNLIPRDLLEKADFREWLTKLNPVTLPVEGGGPGGMTGAQKQIEGALEMAKKFGVGQKEIEQEGGWGT